MAILTGTYDPADSWKLQAPTVLKGDSNTSFKVRGSVAVECQKLRPDRACSRSQKVS